MAKAKNKKEMARAVVVAGVRTPFVKAFNEFLTLDTFDLGSEAVGGLLKKTQLPHEDIDALVWGGVILPTATPNVGREIILDLGLPRKIEAYTVSRACASGLQAITDAVSMIERGDADIVIAGGSDSTSNAEVTLPRKLMQAIGPVVMNKSGIGDWLSVIGKLAPFFDLLPKRPRIAERTTGQLMGEAAEDMAKKYDISRKEQDEFALRSHQRASEAIESGRFDPEVIPVTTPEGKTISMDSIVRKETSLEKLSRLQPAFSKNGTVTAGNSSPLTDGAAAVLLMREEKARELGFTPLAEFESWAYVGVDPADQLLIGPALAMPLALDKAGLKFEEIDLFDLHEAFAGQVLSVLKALATPQFFKHRLGKEITFGKITPDKLNLFGGSIALGHPFGATGARMVTTMANELHKTGKKRAMIGICAAGGLGAAAVLKSAD